MTMLRSIAIASSPYTGTSPAPAGSCRARPSVVQLIRLHQGDPRRIALAPDDCGVRPRNECGEDRRLRIVGWRNWGRDDVGRLVASPIIVNGDSNAIAVVQFERRVLQRIRHPPQSAPWIRWPQSWFRVIQKVFQAGELRMMRISGRGVIGRLNSVPPHSTRCGNPSSKRSSGRSSLDCKGWIWPNRKWSWRPCTDWERTRPTSKRNFLPSLCNDSVHLWRPDTETGLHAAGIWENTVAKWREKHPELATADADGGAVAWAPSSRSHSPKSQRNPGSQACCHLSRADNWCRLPLLVSAMLW